MASSGVRHGSATASAPLDRSADREVLVSMSISKPENLKAIVACFAFLNKVGKELLLEVENNVLTLRALNDAKTAYASVEFDDHFFHEGVSVGGGEDAETFACKVSLKQLCSVCKNLRHVEKLTIRAEKIGKTFDLVLEMLAADTGIVRTHRFKYSDCDVLSAIFDDEGASSLKAPNKVFEQFMGNMYQSPEIAVIPGRDEFVVRSHHSAGDAPNEAKKTLETKMVLSTEEFDLYDFKGTEEDGGNHEHLDNQNGLNVDQQQYELVFCTRELKAILGLCDSINMETIQMFFRTAGAPIKFQTSCPLLVAHLVMTTIASRNAAVSASGPPSASGNVSSSFSSSSFTTHEPASMQTAKETRRKSAGEESGGATTFKRGRKRPSNGDDDYDDDCNDGDDKDEDRNADIQHTTSQEEHVSSSKNASMWRRQVQDDDD